MARGIAAHHHVHLAVEAAVTKAHGTNTYVRLLSENAPRHPASEELLAERLFRSEAVTGLDGEICVAFTAVLENVMQQAPEGRDPSAASDIATALDLVNTDLSLEMTLAEVQLPDDDLSIPAHLVLEPHLPVPVAASIREALLGPKSPSPTA
jgi:hypothetical protein